jgi:hypothetical protein
MRPEKRRVKAIADFWRRFEVAAPKLAALSTADDPLYDELLDHLQAVEPGLYLEFSNSDRPYELIVTADGDPTCSPPLGRSSPAPPTSMVGIFGHSSRSSASPSASNGKAES